VGAFSEEGGKGRVNERKNKRERKIMKGEGRKSTMYLKLINTHAKETISKEGKTQSPENYKQLLETFPGKKKLDAPTWDKTAHRGGEALKKEEGKTEGVREKDAGKGNQYKKEGGERGGKLTLERGDKLSKKEPSLLSDGEGPSSHYTGTWKKIGIEKKTKNNKGLFKKSSPNARGGYMRGGFPRRQLVRKIWGGLLIKKVFWGRMEKGW